MTLQEIHAQRVWARLAGGCFLAAIIVAIAARVVLARIAGHGSFAASTARMAASEHAYRAGLAGSLLVTLSSVLLAFSLYATLKPVHNLLAQFGLVFNLCDSVLAFVVRMCSFVDLHLHLAASSANAEALSDLVQTIAATTENLGGICFGAGSILFFWLFLRSRYIPVALAILGVAASVLWTLLYFAMLIFPERSGLFRTICFPPMLLSELAAGVYLLIFAVKHGQPVEPVPPLPSGNA